MHALLGLTSVVLVVLAGHLFLALLRRFPAWAQRRDLQLVVLAAPLVALATAVGALHHFAGQACFLEAPPWDYLVGAALPLGMGAVAAGGAALGVARLILMHRVVARRGLPAPAELQARADALAARLGTAAPRVRVCFLDRPLALTLGVLRPMVLLSTWMLDNLDTGELDAVIAHEVGHVARRDYPVVWAATVLRDAFCYLPTSWSAHRHLRHEKELACDDLAVRATRRPLALASALAKVWARSAGGGSFAVAQGLVDAGAVEHRIERLLASSPALAGEAPGRGAAIGAAAAALAALLVLQATNLAVFVAPMACDAAAPLRLLLG